MTKENWKDIHEDFARPAEGAIVDWTNQQIWEENGLTYQDAQEWIGAEFEPKDYYQVSQWKNLNFTSQEAKLWINISSLDKDKYEFAAYLRWKSYQPSQDLKLEQLWKEFHTAQNYLDCFCPQNQRNTITQLNLNYKNLTGTLDLSDFVNLEELDCSNNNLTNLIFNSFVNLKTLDLSDNNFHEDLSFLSGAVNLEELNVGNYNTVNIEKLVQGICNKFTGSLKPLKDMKQLKKLSIVNTNIDSGLEYLPDSLKEFNCSCFMQEFKVKEIEQELKKFGEPPMTNFISQLEKWKRSRQETERRIITSLIPTERLFVIRGNLKQFINKWSKPHENDWYESLKEFFSEKFPKKQKQENSNEPDNPDSSLDKKIKNELVKLQSPQEAKWDKRIILSSRTLNNGLATAGIVLSFQGKSDIGAGLLGVYPITEFVITNLEKSLENRETKWKEFLADADAFSDSFNELLGIIKKISAGSELGKTQIVKNLKEKTDKLLEIYDKIEKNEEIDIEELSKERAGLAQDLSDKIKSKWWGVIDDIKKLENLVVNYQTTGSLEEKVETVHSNESKHLPHTQSHEYIIPVEEQFYEQFAQTQQAETSSWWRLPWNRNN